jgi:hypothetical protein
VQHLQDLLAALDEQDGAAQALLQQVRCRCFAEISASFGGFVSRPL